MTTRTRVGAVSYLNTRPLVYGIEHGLGVERVELSYAVPSRLAQAMHEERLDVALLPVIELARLRDLEIVPGLGIVTQGPARSVLLVSRLPPERIRSVGLDAESRTSNVLVQVLLDGVWQRRVEIGPGQPELDRTLACFDAAVRIGDKALFEPLPPGCEAHDLGQAWTAWTGLPFVFAVWAARPGSVDRELYRLLHASRREGRAHTETIAREFTWHGRGDPELCRDYLLHNIRFRLGAAELRGLRRFFDEAQALGLISRIPPLRMALAPGAACGPTAEEARDLTPSASEV